MANHYDVFVSFRGEDTRSRFVSHLVNSLARHRINTFKDNESIERGESISPEIKRSIHKSRLSIIVFSENYAFSPWCLEELVEIMHCKEDEGQIVLPIFHDVDPSEVSNQTSSFGRAFVEHERVLSFEVIQSWRSCLAKAAEIAGWDSRNNQDEAKFIEEIAADVVKKLARISSKQSSELVWMDSRKQEILQLLALDKYDIRSVGICGIQGIGKTTLTRLIYNEISGKFYGSCFLENVREQVHIHGIKHLQDVLVRNVQSGRKTEFRRERVLIVLDDVADTEQLKELVGRHDRCGPGSRIIITTSDEHCLRAYGVCEIYDVERLNYRESLQLFNQHAFKNSEETDEFKNLARIVVDHIRGLPLAIKVLGSSLCGKSLSEWGNEIADLDRNNWEVPYLLSISFDKLEVAQKRVFIDIACFFEGYDADIVAKYIDICGISTEVEVKTLCDKGFLSISEPENKIFINDLLKELAHKVGRQLEAGTCSRLWDSEDVNHALSENKDIENVEIMILDSSKINDVPSLPSVISKMSNLKLLKINNSLKSGSTSLQDLIYDIESIFKLSPLSFSEHLFCFKWVGYPLKYLPEDFHPENLVELYMPYSNLKKFFKNKKVFENLKFINLSHSKDLKRTPNFSQTPNLQELILQGCTNLTEVHSSIATHKSLRVVDMKDCISLRKFPSPIEMKELKFISLRGCSKLQELPEIRGNIEHCWFDENGVGKEETSWRKWKNRLGNAAAGAVGAFSGSISIPGSP